MSVKPRNLTLFFAIGLFGILTLPAPGRCERRSNGSFDTHGRHKSVAGSALQKKHPPDKIRATKSISGKLAGFEFGDYLHAVIEKPNGKRASFFVRAPGMEYFLALHKGEPLQLTYQVVDSHIPEAGGVQRIEQLSAAKAGSLTYASWWRAVRRKFTMEQLEEKYGPLVQKSTIN